MNVLVTGGAGYIGSHAVRMLSEKGFGVVVVDNLCKGHKKSVPVNVKLYEINVGDKEKMLRVFRENKINAVMHFAAFAEVGASMKDPTSYYHNNLVNTINLLDAMVESEVKKIIFSSTCAIFGEPEKVPINESTKKNPINVYGKTKLMIENVLEDYDRAYGLKYVCLRYFNAAGASYGIGEHHDPETHLIPIVLKIALEKKGDVKIFGNDYPTPDGTCVRDYIHVCDLASAHILALNELSKSNKSNQFNLGSGEGYSVKEIIEMSEEVARTTIPSTIVGRRSGDPPKLVADSSKIKTVLDWSPRFGLKEVIESAWNWHKNNPHGFAN